MAKKRPMRRSQRLTVLVVVLVALGAVGVGAFWLVPLALRSPAERRLVGTWELEPASAPPAGIPLPPVQPGPTKADPGGEGARLGEIWKSFGKAVESWSRSMTPDMRVGFERNGTYTEAMGMGGRRQVVRGRWEVAEGGERELTVRVYPDDGDRSRTTELSISFEGDDVMLYPGPAGQPVRMVRRQER